MSSLGQETTVTIGGVNYRLSKFTIPLYQEFISWAKSQLPDPWEGLAERCKGFAPELQKHIIKLAEERVASRGTMNDPEIQAIANSLPGVKKMLSMLFRKYNPGLSEDQVSAVIDEGIAEHGADFFTQSLQGQKEVSAPTPSI